MDTGLTTIAEKDIERHLPTAQGLVTRVLVLTDAGGPRTPLAGTGRRFVPTVSTGGLRQTREVELARVIAAIRPEDTMLSPRQHALLYRSRRAAAVALAVADNFAAASELEPLREKNARAALAGEEAALFKQLLAASAYVAAFTFASYLLQT